MLIRDILMYKFIFFCPIRLYRFFFFFFFNDTATTEIYTLSLHDALPIWGARWWRGRAAWAASSCRPWATRSEEHTSELQSPCNLVCRLLLEKKKKKTHPLPIHTKQITTLLAVFHSPMHLVSYRLPTAAAP